MKKFSYFLKTTSGKGKVESAYDPFLLSDPDYYYIVWYQQESIEFALIKNLASNSRTDERTV